jgi:hypothetical protein
MEVLSIYGLIVKDLFASIKKTASKLFLWHVYTFCGALIVTSIKFPCEKTLFIMSESNSKVKSLKIVAFLISL